MVVRARFSVWYSLPLSVSVAVTRRTALDIARTAVLASSIAMGARKHARVSLFFSPSFLFLFFCLLHQDAARNSVISER